MARERLDRMLVESGLAESRERAQALILAGSVTVDGRTASRAALPVDAGACLEVRARLPFVSRGGVKLSHALERLSVDVADQMVADVGASTGGFTDCLLKRGAAGVYAIDVGHGQLDWRLRNDPRVVVMERTHVRSVDTLPAQIAGATIDVSFISLRLVLPTVRRWLTDEGWIVALVKPQFEAGRERVLRGGVVRDPAVHREVLLQVVGAAAAIGLRLASATASPLLGPSGNREFFVLLRAERSFGDPSVAIETAIAEPIPSGARRAR